MASVPIVVFLAAYLGLSFAAASALYATWDAKGATDAVLRLVDRIRTGSRDEAQLGRDELLNFALGTLTDAGLAAQAQAQGTTVEELRRQVVAAQGALALPGDFAGINAGGADTTVQEGQQGAQADLGGVLAGVLGGVGAGSLALALTSALTNTANARGHAAQAGQFESSGTWVRSLLGYMGKELPLLAGGGGLLFQSQLGDIIRRYASQAFEDLADVPGATAENIEDNATDNAAARFTQALELGTKAQLLSYSLEALGSVKYMGFNQIAGLIGSFAGFDRIAAGVMGTVENASIYQPLRWKANRRYRPTMPNDQAISTLYAKKEITPSQMANYLQRNGLSEFFIEVNRSAAFRDLGLGEVVRVAQFFQTNIAPEVAHVPDAVLLWWGERDEWVDIFARSGVSRQTLLGDDWYFYYKLAKAGYEPVDVVVLVEVAKRATCSRELRLFLSTATRMYRDGFVDDEAYMGLVDEGWAFTNPKVARLRVAHLQTQAQDMAGYRDLVLRSISRGILSESGGRQRLLAAGMRKERVEMELLGERLGGLPHTTFDSGTESADILEEVGL